MDLPRTSVFSGLLGFEEPRAPTCTPCPSGICGAESLGVAVLTRQVLGGSEGGALTQTVPGESRRFAQAGAGSPHAGLAAFILEAAPGACLSGGNRRARIATPHPPFISGRVRCVYLMRTFLRAGIRAPLE